jgi:predicted nucleotidyltransferase component of viral defense system
MKFDPSSFPAAAKATGFQSNNLEKVLRMRELLTEFQKHSFLGGRLVLKGGTALNLFYLGLTRLSVDIDLNYIAHLEREAMLAERSEIVKANKSQPGSATKSRMAPMTTPCANGT